MSFVLVLASFFSFLGLDGSVFQERVRERVQHIETCHSSSSCR